MKKLVLLLLFPSVCWGAGNVNFQAGSGGGSVVIQAGTSSGGGGGTGDVTDVNAGTGILVANPTGPAPTVSLDPNATNYIHNQNTLQSGASSYPDFLYVGSSMTVGTGGAALRGILSLDRPDLGLGLVSRAKMQFDPNQTAAIIKLTAYYSVSSFSGLYSYDYNDHLIGTNGVSEGGGSGNYALALSSFSTGSPTSRLSVSGTNGKFDFFNATGSVFAEFDPVGNSSFTTPIVLSQSAPGVAHVVAGSSQVVTGLVSLSTETTGVVPNASIDGSSITKQGLLVAGSNITLTPGAGTLTIAASGGGGSGYALEPATVTIQSAKGEKASTMTITGLSPGVMHIIIGSSNVVTGLVLSTEVATNLTQNGLVLLFDGGGSALTTSTRSITIPFGCTISSWTVLSDQSGSLAVHISSSSYGNYPTLSNISAAGNSPSLSSAQKNTAAVSGWGQTTFSAGDVLSYVLDTATTVTWATITVWVNKT